MECKIAYFNREEFGKWLGKLLITIISKNRLESVEKIYSLIKSELNKATFAFANKHTGSKYERSILELMNTIITISKIEMNRYMKEGSHTLFKRYMEQNFLADAGINSGSVKNNTDPEVPSGEGNPDMPTDSKRIKLKLNEAIELYYGNIIKAENFRRQQFGIDLLRVAIIDTKNRVIIRSNVELNKAICSLKNQYFKQITSYLKYNDPNFKGSELIFDEKSYLLLPGYELVLDKFYEELNKKKKDNNLEDDVISGWKKRLIGQNDLFYDALNAYINLQYFDTILEDTIGKVILISEPSWEGEELDASYGKYIFSKGDEHKRKSFQNSENRDALKDIAKFSKLILSTIPIYSIVDGKFLNRYVNIGNFANAITSLFRNIYKLGDNYITLQEAVEDFHNNPYHYTQVIFEEITNPQNKNLQNALIKAGVDRFNLNILTSVFKYIYDTKNPNSIKSIETEDLKNRFTVDGYSIIDCINGVIDRTMDATYIQIAYSSDVDMMETTEKKKFTNRKSSYSIINAINADNIKRSKSERERLATTYKIFKSDKTSSNPKENSSCQIYSVQFKGLTITGVSNSPRGFLDSKNFKEIKFGNSELDKLFDPSNSEIDLIDPKNIDKIIEGTNLGLKEQMFRDVIEFIDEFLYTDFLSKDGLTKLFLYKNVNLSSINYLQDILASAIRAAIVNDIYFKFNLELLKQDGKYSSILDFSSFLKLEYTPFGEIDFNNYLETRVFFQNKLGVPLLISVRSSDNWIDNLSNVEAEMNGEISKSTIKDIHGNSIANNRTSYLGGNIKYYLSKYRKAGETAATDRLLFTHNPNLIVKTVFNTDAKSRVGIKKSVKDMKAAELFYSSIIHHFYGTYYLADLNPDKFGKNKNELYKTVLVLPTTYADKTTFIMQAINMNKRIKAKGKSYDEKTLWELNSDLLIDLYKDTIGESYIQSYNNVLDDLRKVLDMNPDSTSEEINSKLQTISQEELLSRADSKNIVLTLDTHYRVYGNVCRLNELLYHYATDLYANKEALIRRFEREKVNFVNDLLASGIAFYINYRDDSDEIVRRSEGQSSSNPISRILDIMFADPKEGDKYLSRSDYEKDWIKNNKLILAKDQTGKAILNGSEIPYDSLVELNPLLEKYFFTDTLLANNLRFEFTGSEIAHPDKTKINYTDLLTKHGINPKTNPLFFKQIKATPKLPDIKKESLFNLEKLNLNEIEYEIEEELWTDDPTKTKTVLKIWIKGHKEYGSFDLVADTDFNNTFYNGEYSVHFKTGDKHTGITKGSTPELRKILYRNLIEAIPMGGKVSTHGELSIGGVNALNKVGSGMFEIGTRDVKDLQQNPLTIPIFQKTEAIDSFKDLTWVKNVPELRDVYDEAITAIEAMSLGTLLKRNVIIPATLQYVLLNVLNGVPPKVKVAVISDTKAKVFNFRGTSEKIDAHDGSAWINPFISLLENKSLQDQEVGVDKKPIWHHYDPKTMSATLLKFATFTITNERMRTSLNSEISLHKLFKQMTNLLWSEDIIEDGKVVGKKWNNSKGMEFDLIKSKGYKKNQFSTIKFTDDILAGKLLYYSEGNTHYLIRDFGRDEHGYYTIEDLVDIKGNPIPSKTKIKVYHLFDKDSNHRKFRNTIPPANSELHTINSLFELHSAMGGIYSEELVEDDEGNKNFKFSDDSSRAVVNFMNNVSIRTSNKTDEATQSNYYQPLKEMMIGYAANLSAVKNGIGNLNSAEAWKGNMKLRYMELDTDGLGILMDADHEIDESEMTEFSLVIAALEAGGRLHHMAKRVYKTLGQLAIKASGLEIDTATKYILAKNNNLSTEYIKNQLYDIFARTIINNYKLREGRVDLASPIITEIRNTFNLSENHALDKFKVPFSDNNLFNQVISTFISNLNSKSIKRKYPGSGCVMVPGFNIIQTHKYRGQTKMFDDVLQEARIANLRLKFYNKSFNSSEIDAVTYNRELVNAYLKYLQKEEWEKATPSVERFIPTDIVDILINGEHKLTVSLDDPEFYYRTFKDDAQRLGYIANKTGMDLSNAIITYATNITKPRNLAPSRIQWLYEASKEENDAILGRNTDNEFGSDVAVILKNPKENVHFLGTSLDFEDFVKWKLLNPNPSIINSTDPILSLVQLVFKRNPEFFNKIQSIGATIEDYANYVKSIFPDSKEKDIYWHGSNSDFSEGFNSAVRGVGSGAPEVGTEFYLAKLPYSVLQYVNGVNRNFPADKNGFAHWNKLFWELKEIMSNGRRENNDWKNIVIGPDGVRQNIPNKKGVFNRDSGGGSGKYLSERKADYGYENKSDEEFFRDVFGIEYGKDTFNTWIERNRQNFLALEETLSGIYPAVINVVNPIIESGLNTYYEEERGLKTLAKSRTRIVTMNIFDTEPVRESFLRANDPTFDAKANRLKILKIFDDLDKGYYLGHKIFGLLNEAAELVISNMYASKFNTKGKSVSEILNKGAKAFSISNLKTIRSLHYDMVFTEGNGNHTYISFKPPKASTNDITSPKNVGWKYKRVITNERGLENVYATTRDGQTLYKIGLYIDVEGVTYKDEKFYNSVTGQEIIDRSFSYRKGKVMEYKEFISNWRVVEKISVGKRTKPIVYNLYVINPTNIFEALGRNKSTRDTVNGQITKILSDLYASSNYNGVRLNYTMSGSSAQRIKEILPNLKLKGTTKEFVDNILLNKYMKKPIDVNKPFTIHPDAYNIDLINYYNQMSEDIFTSFLKSLTFTASRIPAQTLLSFMQMQAVAFTESSKNIAYVSHWLTWLLGSDY